MPGSVNGRLTMDLSAVGAEPVRLRTTNGSVDLALPAGANANLLATTVNGGVNVNGLPFTHRWVSRTVARAAVTHLRPHQCPAEPPIEVHDGQRFGHGPSPARSDPRRRAVNEEKATRYQRLKRRADACFPWAGARRCSAHCS